MAYAEGVGNYASAVGNPGPNAFTGDPTQPTAAEADGIFNRAVVFGNGSLGEVSGGSTSPLKLGNNTAITVGNGSTATVNVPSGTKTNTVAVALGKNKTTQK